MTKSEYTDLVNKLVSKPEEAPVIAQDLVSNISTDVDLIDSQNAKITELENKIRSLQDTNIKLFLQQTGQAPTSEEHTTIDPHELAKKIMEGK